MKRKPRGAQGGKASRGAAVRGTGAKAARAKAGAKRAGSRRPAAPAESIPAPRNTPSDPRARVCVVGSINMDLVVRAPRLPNAGETILGGPFAVSPGGKGANQAVAAARMGAAVSMIGGVGSDAQGKELLKTLSAEGLDVSAVVTRPGVPSGTALITVAEGGENTIVVASGANARVSAADVAAHAEAIASADALLMQLETPMETVIRAAEMAREAGVSVMLNAAPGRVLPPELLGLVDVLIVNEAEAAAAVGAPMASPRECAERLAGLGPSLVVLTVGAGGSYAHHERRERHIAPFVVQPVDTVGAGDAFCGALAARLAEHRVHDRVDAEAVLDALSWASAAGALATTRAGAMPSLPRRAEVVRLLSSIPEVPGAPV